MACYETTPYLGYTLPSYPSEDLDLPALDT